MSDAPRKDGPSPEGIEEVKGAPEAVSDAPDLAVTLGQRVTALLTGVSMGSEDLLDRLMELDAAYKTDKASPQAREAVATAGRLLFEHPSMFDVVNFGASLAPGSAQATQSEFFRDVMDGIAKASDQDPKLIEKLEKMPVWFCVRFAERLRRAKNYKQLDAVAQMVAERLQGDKGIEALCQMGSLVYEQSMAAFGENDRGKGAALAQEAAAYSHRGGDMPGSLQARDNEAFFPPYIDSKLSADDGIRGCEVVLSQVAEHFGKAEGFAKDRFQRVAMNAASHIALLAVRSNNRTLVLEARGKLLANDLFGAALAARIPWAVEIDTQLADYLGTVDAQ